MTDTSKTRYSRVLKLITFMAEQEWSDATMIEALGQATAAMICTQTFTSGAPKEAVRESVVQFEELLERSVGTALKAWPGK
jgi:hypothetical protein